MSNVTTTARSQSQLPLTPKIYNVSVLLAATEYSQALTNNTKKFTIQCIGGAKTQLAFVLGDSGLTYVTIQPGTAYCEDGIDFSGTLYFRCNKAAQIIEIVEWV